MHKTKLLVERSHTISRRTKNPRDRPIIPHHSLDQGATHTFAPMAFCHDKHRDITIRHAVAKCTKKANYFATFNRDKDALRAGK